MIIISTIHEMQAYVQVARKSGASIGLVPTMGYLHTGHGALMERAKNDNQRVIVSIFVNPLQFGPNEDLDRYPRDLPGDERFCSERGVDVVFAPTVTEMYGADGALTRIHVATLGEHLCGAARPGHFDGVATVVAKLFHIIQPERAYFGQKDFQQLSIVRRMVGDLSIPVDIVAVDTVREADGLAKSSRNAYLTPEQRKLAPRLREALLRLQAAWSRGERDVPAMLAEERAQLEAVPEFRVDYLTCVDSDRLQPVNTPAPGQSVVFALAVFLGKTRLIDNLIVQ